MGTLPHRPATAQPSLQRSRSAAAAWIRTTVAPWTGLTYAKRLGKDQQVSAAVGLHFPTRILDGTGPQRWICRCGQDSAFSAVVEDADTNSDGIPWPIA
jgi:hypothetical protein